MNHEQRMGGWTTFETQITKEEQQVFETATKELVGVGYKPVAVATQVVMAKITLKTITQPTARPMTTRKVIRDTD